MSLIVGEKIFSQFMRHTDWLRRRELSHDHGVDCRFQTKIVNYRLGKR